MNYIDVAIKNSKAYFCLDCGKCTANCPISQYNEEFSPRKIINQAVLYNQNQVINNELIWSCLTCQMCSERCPSDVSFSQFIIDVRKEALNKGKLPQCSHGGVIQTVMKMMANPNLKQKRTEWIPKKLKTSKKGDVLYFVGCLPYYDNIFSKDIDVKPLEIGKSTIEILNYLGIEPVILEDERCCGADLLTIGDKENFEKLAKINISLIKESGASTIVTACAECYNILKNIYPSLSKEFKVKVWHISQFINEKLDSFKFKSPSDKKVTYQDPCRLGRYNGVYDEPRNVLTAIPDVELVEMVKNRNNALCCGTNSWINCDANSKQIQVRRLKQAVNTDGSVLITACPKCEIHFKCAMNDENLDKNSRINIKDLTVFFASSLKSGA